MLGLDSVDSVAHVIQVALTPVFLLSGIASLLGVLSTRLARVADRVDALAEQLEAGGPVDGRRLRLRLAYLRRRSHVLDAAVMMGTLGGVRNVLCRVAFVRRHPSRSAWRGLIRGLWFGAAFHDGRPRRFPDRNAARQSRVARSGGRADEVGETHRVIPMPHDR